MDENPPVNSDSPSATSTNPQTAVPKKSNVLIYLVIVLLILILGVGVFIAWQIYKNSGNKQVKPVSQVSQVTPAANKLPEKSPATSAAQIKKITYNTKGTVWVINSDGTGKSVLFSAGAGTSVGIPEQFFIPGLVWKNSHQVSFILCASKGCAINSVDLATPRLLIEEANPGEFAGVTQILALNWNHVGNQLAYIYKLPDGQMRMDFKSGAVKNVVKDFAVNQFGRGGSLDDNVSIYFSPDDKYVLVTNTAGQPNVNDSSTIWVFEASGKEILNIKSDTNSWATQARWVDNQSFIFKENDKLWIDYELQFHPTPTRAEIFSQANYYNPVPFNGQSEIYFWVNTNTLPYVGRYIGGDKVFPEKFINGYFKPEDLSEKELVALKAQKAPAGQDTLSPFISAGLSIIDINTKRVTDLDSGDINLFAVTP